MIEIVPAIDIIDGKCVRLTKGDYNRQKVYSGSPVDVAKSFEDCGCTSLHMVDLDGAKSKHIVNYKVLEQVASHTSLHIDFGGGLKSDDDLRIAFECGAEMITGGSVAVKNPEMFEHWLMKFGPEKIILGADSRDGMISTDGWLENSDCELVSFVKRYASKGIKRVISTDINRDGMMKGPAVDLYRQVLAEVPDITLIASGGVSKLDDVMALDEIGIPAVIVGKAIYENGISLADLSRFNSGR
ncbi:MAG: 1-(5-phosphoribosyl)-5-[(5-phosphoribosylamino)methylideneamino]imidazole-4-carboxamide isomerase [Muribaculaceae bacterium]